MKKSKGYMAGGKTKGYAGGGKLPMVEKDGKQVPFFAADGKAKWPVAEWFLRPKVILKAVKLKAWLLVAR